MAFFIICIVVLAGWILWKIRKNAKQLEQEYEIQRSFDSIILHILKNQLSQEDYQKLFSAFEGDTFSGLIRGLKQINESIYLATTSKKQDIAESRMAFAIDRSDDMKENYASLLTPFVVKEIDQYLIDAQERFNTQMYINVSNGHVEKADSLKTAKGKLKHLGLARDMLQTGIKSGKGNIIELENALNAVNTTIASLN